MGQFLSRLLEAIVSDDVGKKNPVYGVDVGDESKSLPFNAKDLQKNDPRNPYVTPSFFQRLAAPNASNQVMGLNRQFQMAPLQAQQDLDIAVQQQPTRTRLALAQAEDFANQAMRLKEQFNPQEIALGVAQRKAYGMADEEQRKQFFPQQMGDRLTEQEESSKLRHSLALQQFPELNRLHTQAQAENEQLLRDNKIAMKAKEIAQLRKLGQLPAQYASMPDEDIATLEYNRELSKGIGESALGLDQLNTQRAAAEAQAAIPRLGTQRLGAEAELGAMQGNPQAVNDIARFSLLGDAITAQTGGIRPSQFGSLDNITRITPEGNVTLDKGIAPNPLDELMQQPTLGGKIILGPDGQPLQRNAPMWQRNTAVHQPAIRPAAQNPGVQAAPPAVQQPILTPGERFGRPQQDTMTATYEQPVDKAQQEQMLLSHLEQRLQSERMSQQEYTDVYNTYQQLKKKLSEQTRVPFQLLTTEANLPQ